jgi:exosortase/archaeosortase family protein
MSLAGVALALCYFPYRRGSQAAATVEAFLHAYAAAAGFLLRAVDPGVQVHGVEINGAFFMRMVRTCDAMDVTILFVAGVGFWRGSILRRTVASLSGAFALVILNLVRICNLYVIGMVRPSLFEMAHLDVWPAIMLIAAVGLFWVFVSSDPGRVPVPAFAANRRSLGVFAFRFALVFGLLLAPLPCVASAYAIVIGHATNAVVWAVEKPFPLKARYVPPTQLVRNTPWAMSVFMEDQERARSAVAAMDLRLFSYRPMVAFIALAAASTRRGLRRSGVLWAGGGCLMFALTTILAALPVLARFASWGSLGGAGVVAVAAYHALATPVVIYALSAIAWWRLGGPCRLGIPKRGASHPCETPH